MDLKIINPIEYYDWDKILLKSEEYSFFHTSNWAKVLHETYGYKPLFFSVFDKYELCALVPVVEINSYITGKRGISLPFSDYCPLLFKNAEDIPLIMADIVRYGKIAKWKLIELRWGKGFFNGIEPSSTFFLHTLDLSLDLEDTLSSFRDSTRRNIKKALREGLDSRIHYSLEAVQQFYELNCLTRKRHGLPPQPFSFFKKIYKHVISKKLGFVALASYHNQNIAGAICFHFGKKAFYKYAASDNSFQHLRPNNLVMWECLKFFIRNGFKEFCLGITEHKNQGLIQFKNGWKGSCETLNYYRYNIKKSRFEQNTFRNKVSYSLFKKLPAPLLNLTGSLIYKHIA